MEIVRCDNGHFYDADRFSECPHCNPTSGAGVTVPAEDIEEIDGDVTSPVQEDEGKTIRYYDDLYDVEQMRPERAKMESPVVGWVVGIDGIHRGQDFPLKAGRNFIGRSAEMDIKLDDKTISRERHAVIVFEPKSNIFLVAPGDAHELFYVNGEVVLSPRQIKAYDVISMGKTQMSFIPFCGEQFSWNSEKKEQE